MKEDEDTIGSYGIIGGSAPWPLPKYTFQVLKMWK
jgi:hypothetical protein